MIDPRRQAFVPYLRQLADLMGLKDWEFVIDSGDPNPSCVATCRMRYAQKEMGLRIGEEFLESSAEEKRKTLVHELVHCHMESGWECAGDSMPESCKPTFVRQMEYGVDGIARAWAPTLPLPE